MLRLVSLDLDGTLIHPAIFNAVADKLGFGDKLEETTRAYFEGRMTADETFVADYKHFVGRSVADMRAALVGSDAWIPGIATAVGRLHDAGIRTCVTTDQPDFLAESARELFGVDDLVCSAGEVRHGRVTGTYLLESDKWANLARHLKAWRIDAADVAHVGNGRNDVPVFKRVGDAIAVNPMHPEVAAAARAAVSPLDDLNQVVDLLLSRSGA